MDRRVLIGGLGIIALVAIVLVITQSQTLSQTQATLAAARGTATALAGQMADQLTAVNGTSVAMSTQAAVDQQQALSDLQDQASAAQSTAVSAAQAEGAAAQEQALSEMGGTATANVATIYQRATGQAATLQANATQAIVGVMNENATAQAQALSDAGDTAATAQSQALNAAQDAAATTQANALSTAENSAATAQAQAVSDAEAAGAAALAAQVEPQNATATAVAGQLAEAQGAVATSAALYEATQTALNEQLATLQAQLAAVQSIVTTPTDATGTPSSAQDATVTPGANATAQTVEATLIPGWQRVAGRGVAIQLPDSFNAPQNVDASSMASILRAMGPEFEASAAMFESNPDLFRLVAVDTRTKNNVFTNVIVLRQQLPASVSLDLLVNATVQSYPSAITVVDNTILQLGGHEVARVLIENHLTGAQAKQAQYFLLDGDVVWILTFSTSAGEFDDRLPTFDQSVASIEFLPEE